MSFFLSHCFPSILFYINLSSNRACIRSLLRGVAYPTCLHACISMWNHRTRARVRAVCMRAHTTTRACRPSCTGRIKFGRPWLRTGAPGADNSQRAREKNAVKSTLYIMGDCMLFFVVEKCFLWKRGRSAGISTYQFIARLKTIFNCSSRSSRQTAFIIYI